MFSWLYAKNFVLGGREANKDDLWYQKLGKFAYRKLLWCYCVLYQSTKCCISMQLVLNQVLNGISRILRIIQIIDESNDIFIITSFYVV